jgi:DNA-directed RNA polymerase subunit RPC12/RpoP
MTITTVKLTVISAPAIGHIFEAPPALTASDHSLDYTCGRCGTILLHADDDQVHGLLIRCSNCGSYNKTAA